MTPMVFAKGLADAGYWGDKLFGRVVSEDLEVDAGFLRKACRARAIYGLEPLFESGHTCVIKVHNFIVFGTKSENSLVEKNYDITIQVGTLGQHPPADPHSAPVLYPRSLPASLCFLPLFECFGGVKPVPAASDVPVILGFSSVLGAPQSCPVTCPLTSRTGKQLAVVLGEA